MCNQCVRRYSVCYMIRYYSIAAAALSAKARNPSSIAARQPWLSVSGGTGVAALAELKSKVYQQLEPDNPNEVLPRYDHIQFLAIDSDETDIDKMRGKARLNKGAEFFNISNPHLKAALAAKGTIKGGAGIQLDGYRPH